MQGADHSSRGVIPNVVRLSVIAKHRKMWRSRPPRGCRAMGGGGGEIDITVYHHHSPPPQATVSCEEKGAQRKGEFGICRTDFAKCIPVIVQHSSVL
jgi:hypothetical protein